MEAAKQSSSQSPTMGAWSWAGSLVESYLNPPLAQQGRMLRRHGRNSSMVTTGAGYILEKQGQPKKAMESIAF